LNFKEIGHVFLGNIIIGMTQRVSITALLPQPLKEKLLGSIA
jgi:hypothetical protein